MSEPENPARESEKGAGAAPASGPSTQSPGEQGGQGRKRQRPVQVLPTDRVSFQKQKDALKAYASKYEAASEPVTNAQVGALIGLNATTTGLMNNFFVETGLLEKVEGGFKPSEEVRDYLRAVQWEDEFPGKKLKPALSTTWFAKALLPPLSVGPKEQKEALQILAREANADRAYRPHLKILLEYLEFGGLIERDGEVVRATPPERSTPQAAKEEKQPAPNVVPPAFSRSVELASGGTFTISATIDPFALSQEDREFVYKHVDDLIAYAEKHKKAGQSKKEEGPKETAVG
jgi:hypothetical protein